MLYQPTEKLAQSRRPATRRQFLAATAGVSLGTVAGCSGVNREFEATPVVLSEDAQEEMVLAQTSRASTTRTIQAEVVDGEVSITNQFAAYARGLAREQPTLIERYLGRINGTKGAGPAVVATASDVGLDEVMFDAVGTEPGTLSGNRVSMVAPAGLRSEEPPAPISGPFLLGWMTDNAIPKAETFEEAPWVVDAKDFFPGLVYLRGQKYDPMKQWVPASELVSPDNFLSEGTVLVALGGSSPQEVFGITEEKMPGERLQEGDAEQPFNPFLIAVPGSVAFGDRSPVAERYKNFFNVATPAWVGGATYGLGVLSTPAAKVGEESTNPLARLGLQDLLTSEQGRELVPGFGGAEAPDDAPDWLSGPAPVAEYALGIEPVTDSSDATSILDQETDLKGFLGVVSGENGPWGVAVHLARIEYNSDLVITAGAYHWPVGSAKYFDTDRGERFSGIFGSIIIEAQGLTAAAGKRFDYGTTV